VRFGDREFALTARRVAPRPVGRITRGPAVTPQVEPRSAEGAISYITAVAENPGTTTWYHTIELPDGTVTPGAFDHRELVAGYGFPDDMTGTTALDVATFDGFWAFEMEKRGATVSAVDLARHNDSDLPPEARALLDTRYGDVPTAPTFEDTRAKLGSSVQRLQTNVYDLDPAVHGTYDFVHCADLLVHLERPWAALRAIRGVTRGQALIVDAYDPDLPRGPRGPTTQYLGGWHDVVWWCPSLDALAQQVIDAGFRSVRVHQTYSVTQVGNDEPGFWRAALIADV
jgi:tRNA (mo5U34)-methyltransferase